MIRLEERSGLGRGGKDRDGVVLRFDLEGGGLSADLAWNGMAQFV